MLPIKDIENFVQNKTRNVSSVVHDFSHLKRTAVGAKWFVKVLGGTNEDEKLVYIAGLLHDIVRPASEKICHAEASALASRQILKKFIKDEENINKIVHAIASHRDIKKCKSVLDKSLIFSDKILEQMGGFVVFRRCMFIGECVDYKNKDFTESVIKHFEDRLAKYNPDEFSRRLSKLVNYQYQWPKKFWEDFKNNEQWAVNIAKHFYEYGREKQNIEQAIKTFQTKFTEDKKYHEEAIRYVDGNKFSQFRRMIK